MRRTVLSLVLLATCLSVSPGGAGASAPASVVPGAPTTRDDLPAGWSWDGMALVWTADERLPMGGARIEFRVDGAVIGYATEAGSTARLDGARALDLDGDLSVWRAGRRLDIELPEVIPAPDLPVIAPRVLDVDPAARGPFSTRRFSYQRAPITIDVHTTDVEVLAEVTAPVGARGRLPLVVLLHGRHGTCFTTNDEISGDWPCPSGWRPVPSHRGYRYMADALASQGHLVVSISANAINAQDGFVFDGGAGLRSTLVRHHLDLWAQWDERGNDPWGGRFEDRVDLSEVVLVGHSRGGEGVARAAIDSRPGDPWRIGGLVLVAPTAFTRIAPQQAHTVVLLPACDGDVSDLQGQQYVDVARDAVRDGALRSAVFVPGANHNFFNTEWTPGLAQAPADDDATFGGLCNSSTADRLTPGRQRAVGLAYVAALVHLVTRPSADIVAVLDGGNVVPRGVGGTPVSVSAVGGDSRLVVSADTAEVAPVGTGDARRCVGRGGVSGRASRASRPPCNDFSMVESPHWLMPDAASDMPSPGGTRVVWSSQRGGARYTVPVDLSRATSLDLRMIVPRPTGAVGVSLRLSDADGDTFVLPMRMVRPQSLGWLVARQVRVPLRSVPARVDLSRVRSIDVLTSASGGSVVVLDVWARRGSVPEVSSRRLPVISVATRQVIEGSTERDLRVGLDIRGTVERPARLWVSILRPAEAAVGRWLTIEPGQTRAHVMVPLVGNTTYDGTPRDTNVAIYAGRAAVVSRTYGGLMAAEDDPAPSASVDVADVSTAEGGDLVWTVRLSDPVNFVVGWEVQCTDGSPNAISSADVTADSVSFQPDPPLPLCAAGVNSFAMIDQGLTETTIRLGTVADGLVETAETVTLTVVASSGDPILPTPLVLTGTIEASN